MCVFHGCQTFQVLCAQLANAWDKAAELVVHHFLTHYALCMVFRLVFDVSGNYIIVFLLNSILEHPFFDTSENSEKDATSY